MANLHHKLLGRWHVSLPAKITIIVFWGLVIIGFIASLILLNGAEQELSQRFKNNTDKTAYYLDFFFDQRPDASIAEVKQKLEDIQQSLGIEALELELDSITLRAGMLREGQAISKRFVQYHLNEEGHQDKDKAYNHKDGQLRVYQPSLKQAVKDRRKNLLMGMGILFLTFGMSLALVLQNILTKPFMRMLQVADEFSQGNTSLRFDTARKDEFGYLAKFINKSLDLLLQKHSELEQAIEKVKQSEAELYEQKERAEVTLHSIGDAVITTDAEGQVQYLNPTAERITGWTSHEANGQPLDYIIQLFDERTGNEVENPIYRCLRKGQCIELSNNSILIRRSGEEMAIADSAAPIRDKSGETIGAIMVFHDVEETRKLARQLSYQASHDALTGLRNRRSFEKHLQQAINNTFMDACQHALCYLDLDQFKIVNDTCGHVAGDELLRQLADLLEQDLRESDIIARLGGDEFGILLQYCDMEHAQTVAEKLRNTIKKHHFMWQGHQFEIGVSIGLVPISSESGGINEVMSSADMACYAAKDKGRNRVHVWQPDDSEMRKRQGEMQWVPRIKHALDEDRFELYFQTISTVEEHNATKEHFELLVRMIDENGAIVPPMAFIPAAERYQLMPAIDRWVVRHAFAFLNNKLADRSDYICAINLSGQSLDDDNFLKFVVRQLDDVSFEPENICFEITETAAIANLSKAMRFVNILKGIGCKFALDDFGSGLSSFAYLKSLAVDYLKIDGSFIRDLVSDPIDYAMVDAINGIGHVMNIRTIAEFVENDDIMQELKALGVDYAQGYGISKPQPIKYFGNQDSTVATRSSVVMFPGSFGK